MTLEAGRTVVVDHEVEPRHLAPEVGSGDVAVLATPVLLAWCEAACMAAVVDDLEPGTTTVGMRVRLDHVRPTPVGATVSVHAELARVEGRRLSFEVRVCDSAEDSVTAEVAHGQVVRVIVDRDRFEERAARP